MLVCSAAVVFSLYMYCVCFYMYCFCTGFMYVLCMQYMCILFFNYICVCHVSFSKGHAFTFSKTFLGRLALEDLLC